MNDLRGKKRKTEERILTGTLKTMAIRGIEKLSIDDICHHAQVSKRTLYRYFENKEAILTCISGHIHQQFLTHLSLAIKKNDSIKDRIKIVTTFLCTYPSEHPDVVALATSNPTFVLNSVLDMYDEYLDMIFTAIEPAFTANPLLNDAEISPTAFAELIMRLAIQALLTPAINPSPSINAFIATWDLAVKQQNP
jgi:AcrR family transcriptional regulator